MKTVSLLISVAACLFGGASWATSCASYTPEPAPKYDSHGEDCHAWATRLISSELMGSGWQALYQACLAERAAATPSL